MMTTSGSIAARSVLESENEKDSCGTSPCRKVARTHKEGPDQAVGFVARPVAGLHALLRDDDWTLWTQRHAKEESVQVSFEELYRHLDVALGSEGPSAAQPNLYTNQSPTAGAVKSARRCGLWQPVRLRTGSPLEEPSGGRWNCGSVINRGWEGGF